MEIKLKRVVVEDLNELKEMEKACFKELLERYNDGDKNPYNESLERLKSKIENSDYYFIVYDNKNVGAIRIVKMEDNIKKISPLYVLPEYQGKGIAQTTLQMVEDMYGKEDWVLDTILEEKGNCHLYEKMGYKKTGKYKKISDIETLVYYRK